MRIVAGAAAALVLAVGSAGVPTAAADVEPNGAPVQAAGPLTGGVPYRGTLFSSDDLDYYLFYAASQQQIEVVVPYVSGGRCAPSVTLLRWNTFDEAQAAPDDTHPGYLRYTTAPGTNPYFLLVDGSRCLNSFNETPYPKDYEFTVNPSHAVLTGPAINTLPVPVPETGGSAGTATRIIQGSTWYGGTFETGNDQDHLAFSASGSPFEVQAGTLDRGCSLFTDLRRDGRQRSFKGSGGSGVGPGFHTVDETPGRPALYYLALTGDVGCRWQVRIEPPAGLRRTPSSQCRRARRAEAKVARQLATARQRLARAISKRARSKAKRRVKAKRQALRHGRAARRLACTEQR